MKKIFLGLCVLALASCGLEKKGSDGYAFETKEFERPTVEVTLVQYDTRKDFEESAARHGLTLEQIRTLKAFSSIPLPTDKNTCTIHVMNVEANYEPEFIGHEYVHCVFGRFHK